VEISDRANCIVVLILNGSKAIPPALRVPGIPDFKTIGTFRW
jgi:hypothetical protein